MLPHGTGRREPIFRKSFLSHTLGGGLGAAFRTEGVGVWQLIYTLAFGVI